MLPKFIVCLWRIEVPVKSCILYSYYSDFQITIIDVLGLSVSRFRIVLLFIIWILLKSKWYNGKYFTSYKYVSSIFGLSHKGWLR